MSHVKFNFIPAGSVVSSESGKIYVDVGNDFGPGILDHHHSESPDSCATMISLEHPELILSQQIDNHPLEIITHLFPDIDAIGSTWFAKRHIDNIKVETVDRILATYICNIDRGNTTLHPSNPISAYSVMMMRLTTIYSENKNPIEKSNKALYSGFKILEIFRNNLESADNLDDKNWLESLTDINDDIQSIENDLKLYNQDIHKAEKFTCSLPKMNGIGFEQFPGLWISKPKSALFKSWARGDEINSKELGFVFTAIEIDSKRSIISVPPDKNVYLKGLGDLLEKAEEEKREKTNKIRLGRNRPGYNSPDPWYDGRTPLHNYTIIDSPRLGTILTKEEIKSCILNFCKVK